MSTSRSVGGVRVADPGADLAVCLALASAATGVPVGDDVVVLGEVGLGGEVRQVAHTPRRLAEAARLGFHPGAGARTAALRRRHVDLLRVPTLARGRRGQVARRGRERGAGLGPRCENRWTAR